MYKVFNPKVSIVIPVYNGSNYLRDAIKSALAQTYKNIEVIVINDGSTDNGATEKIAKSFGNKIRYFKKDNGGVATALNLGIEKMTGDYFSWLSHDDKYKPDRTRKMVQLASKSTDKEKTIIASSFIYFDDSTKFLPPKTKKFKPAHPLSYLYLGYINGCALLIPKTVLLNDGKFDEKRPTTQDFELWFRILRSNKIKYLNEQLTLSRSHEEQGSKALIEEHVKECDALWINMMEALSKTEKSSIFGSELNFYSLIHEFLKTNTLYIGATYYAKKKEFEILKQKVLTESYKPDYIENFDLNLSKHKKTIFFPIFGHYSDRHGLNKMLSMVANRLAEKYNVVIASFTDKDQGYPLNKNISYICVSSKYLAVDNFEDITILFDVDIVVVSHNCCKSGLDLISKVKAMNKKVIAWNHEDYFLPYISRHYCEVWPIRQDALMQADAVLWLTNASCAAYFLNANNGLVMPNFVHFDNFKVNNNSEVKIFNNIITVARYNDPRKRINKLLECYEEIIKAKPDMKLTILDDLDKEMMYNSNETVGQAINRINKNGGHINVVGFVDDIEKYYSTSDIHILPSYCEGFGLTILESAYYGVPSAVFNNSGFEDIITDGENGIIAPEADTNVLAERIINLFNDKEQLIKMKKSSKKIINKFDENILTSNWNELIEDLINNKKIKFNKYSYNIENIQKISNNYENALAEFAKDYIPYRKFTNKILESYDRILISKTWKMTQPIRSGAAVARKIKKGLVK